VCFWPVAFHTATATLPLLVSMTQFRLSCRSVPYFRNHGHSMGTMTQQLLHTTGRWLIDNGVRICLRTVATNGPIVHPPGDIWTWWAMVMTTSAGYNPWLVHQSSLAVLPAETSGASRRNGRRSENFAYQYLKYLKESLTCHKILRHGTSGFTSHPKEGVLRILRDVTV
jgi:hypothetical protein